MKKNNKGSWFISFIIAGLLIWLLLSLDLEAILEIFTSLEWPALLGGSLLLMVGMQIIPLRWYLLQDDRQGFIYIYQTNAITFFARMLMPIPIPLLRMTITTLTSTTSLAQITPAVIAERIVETLMRGVTLIVLVSSLRGGQPKWALLWISILMALFAGFVWLSSRSATYFPRLVNWLKVQPWGKSPKLHNTLANMDRGIAAVGQPRRLISTLLASFLMAAIFLAGHAWLFETIGVRGSLADLLTLAAAVVFLLPPSTSQMIIVYLLLLQALLLPLRWMDVNTILAYGLIAGGIQLLFWGVTGLWGLAHTRLRFREIWQMLDEIKDQLALGDQEPTEPRADRDLDRGNPE